VTDPETGGVLRVEPQYTYVDVPYRALVLKGKMSVKCEVTDVATGILLYSDRFDALYTNAREVGSGPSAVSVDDLNSAYLKLADNAMGLILVQLCPRVYSEIVALPSGKLKEASKLLEAGHWSEALTLLSSMPAFKDSKDDAYRFYSIGVAREALAYKALDHFEKKGQLERAVDNYRLATELKPNEDMFWPPKNRAEFVLWQTSGLVAQVEVFQEAKKPGSKAVTSSDRTAPADLFRQTRSQMQPGPMLINNETVVQWVKAGRSSDYITASIKHAPGTRFDLSKVEVLKLHRDGVNKSVLKAMAKAQQGRRPGHGRARAVITAVSLLWWLPFVFGR
jgi:tetratricopeptide (TPR) repeat protein